jgi:hypothetical protein
MKFVLLLNLQVKVTGGIIIKKAVSLMVAGSLLLPSGVSAKTCDPVSLGGYTLGTSKPDSEVRLMRCNKTIDSKCVSRMKRFEDNGLTYIANFRVSDGVIYEITAEKRDPTLEDYQYFLGLLTEDMGAPSADGGFVAYRTTSTSNGIFTTERKTRTYMMDVKFACWGDCEAQTVNEKGKKRTGNGPYLPKAINTYIKGTQLTKADGLAISFDKRQNGRKTKMFLTASCASLKAGIKDLEQESERTGRY